MANVYNVAKERFADGVLQWDTTTDNLIRCALVDGPLGFSYQHATLAAVIAASGGEISPASYVRGNVASRSTTIDTGTNTVFCDASDVDFGSLENNGDSIRAAIVYEHFDNTNDANNFPICAFDFGADTPLNGGNITVAWDTSPSAVFTLGN